MDPDITKKLEKYLTVIEKLKSSRFLTETKNVGTTFGAKEDIVSVSTHGYDEDLLRSFLLDFRKIYSQKEATNFYSICNLVELNCTDPDIKENVRYCRNLFSNALEESPFPLILNGVIEKPRVILDKWINGGYFHEDDELEEQLNRLGFSLPIHKWLFVTTVQNLTMLSIITANNIKNLLKQSTPKNVSTS